MTTWATETTFSFEQPRYCRKCGSELVSNEQMGNKYNRYTGGLMRVLMCPKRVEDPALRRDHDMTEEEEDGWRTSWG
jgi:hypothetical protein